MRFKLHHPLWTHLPALACIALNMGLLLYAQLPARVSVDFKNGLLDHWGSPLELWFQIIGLPLLLVTGSAIFDERYARLEQDRRFNWISLIDECWIGIIAGSTIEMIPQLTRPEPALWGAWPWAYLVAGGAVVSAALLELRRPYRPEAQRRTAVDVAALAHNIQPQFQPGGRWLYWEKHNPLWWRCLVVLITVPAVVAAVEMAKKSNYGGVVFFALLAILCLSSYGGMHVVVTPGRLTIRSWILGLPFLRLKLANVKSVEVVEFNALVDQFGWGLYRYSLSLRAWGFILGGNRGVMVQMKKGRKFLITSFMPEKLAAATEAARIASTLSPNDVKGSVAAVQEIFPSQNTIRSDPDSTRTQSSRSRRFFQGLYRAAAGILVILILAILLHDPESVKYTITSEGLTIHDFFYSVTIKSTDIDIEHIKVVDIGADPHWHPTEKINGTSSKRYKAGWFRVAGGEKVRLYRTTSQRLVLLPPKGPNAPVLMEAKQPEAFIQKVRQAWR